MTLRRRSTDWPTGRLFRLVYLNRTRADREILPHQTRDCDASLALYEPIFRMGYHYAGPLYNYPGADGEPTSEPQITLAPNDLIVLTTRPPLDDDLEPGRNTLVRSYTSLETRVFQCIKRHLQYCSRRRVAVALAHVRASKNIARLGNIQFGVHGGARIDAVQSYYDGRWRRQSEDLPDTVAYLMFDREAWPGGPALLASFGMSGTDTLAWNFILAKEYAHLIGKVSFAMAEIRSPCRPRHPGTLEFLKTWQVTVHPAPERSMN